MDVGLISIIVPLPDTVTIPATWFRFASKTDLLNLGENPSYYPGIYIKDVILILLPVLSTFYLN